MATRQELINALRKADKAGDVEAVNDIANYLDTGEYEKDTSFKGNLNRAIDNDPVVGAAENILSFCYWVYC